MVYASLAAVAAGAIGQQASTGDSVVDTIDGLRLTAGPDLLEVKVLEDGVVDIHVMPGGVSSPRTLVMSPHPHLFPLSGVVHHSSEDEHVVSTPKMSVRLATRAPYGLTVMDSSGRQLLQNQDPLLTARSTNVTLMHAEGEDLYGMKGLVREDSGAGLMRNGGATIAAGIQGDSGAPFTFTLNYAVLVDSDGGEFTTRDDSFTFHHSSRKDVEFFIAVGRPMETIAAISRLVGPPPLPPKWTLGFINSQWGATQPEIEKIVATYRERRLPIDGFVLDFDWKAWGEDNYGEWRWNSTSGKGSTSPDKFPDGASGEFASQLRAQGIKLGGILKPRILTTVAGDTAQPTEAAAYATAHNFWYPGEAPGEDYFTHRQARNLDFGNPAMREWFWDHLRPAFDAGMLVWWNDEADYSANTIFNNFQFLNMGRALYEGQRGCSNTRVWSINRNFYLGSSRYGYAGWSGDIATGFASMAYQRRRMLAALNTGEFHWSMDTGGFAGHPTPENYARWMEFAAFVPIMRVHGDLNERRQPWVYGPVAEEAARHALEMRYTLLPYIYSYERLNSEGKVGLVRPLMWEFPDDAKSVAENSEWMFGDALLVAPVVAHGATVQHVYLPPGEWFDYASGRRYSGSKSIHFPVDSATWKDIPLFVRAGSIVATRPLEQYVGERPVPEITLDVFPSRQTASFTEYDDDGETYAYESGNYLRQKITAVRDSGGVRLIVDPSNGSYQGALRTYLLRIHTGAGRVSVNGQGLSPVDAAQFRNSTETAWTRNRDRFGASTLIRIAAGGIARTNIHVQYRPLPERR